MAAARARGCGGLVARRAARDVHRQRLGAAAIATRCLCTTNIIETPSGIVRRSSRRVTRYRDADMALRWTATGFIEAQRSFRKIQGVKDLWILKTALGRPDREAHVDEAKMAA